MRLVETMTQHPPTCLHCGNGNTEQEPKLPVLDLEREVNWGDSTYICGRCMMVAALLYDFVSPEVHQELTQTIESLKGEKHELKALLEVRERRLQSIVEGRKAERAVKAGV